MYKNHELFLSCRHGKSTTCLSSFWDSLGGGTERWRLGVVGLSVAVVLGCGRGLRGGKSGARGRERGGGAEDGGLSRREGGMVRVPGGGGLRVRLWSCRDEERQRQTHLLI